MDSKHHSKQYNGGVITLHDIMYNVTDIYVVRIQYHSKTIKDNITSKCFNKNHVGKRKNIILFKKY